MKVVHVETGRHLYGGALQILYLTRGLQARGIESTVVCEAGSHLDDAARGIGLIVRNVHCGGDLDLLYVFRLYKLLRELSPDLVHCHSRRGADFLGGRAARLARISAVLSRRVDSHESPFIARLRYAPFNKIVAISQNVADSLQDARVDPARITMIRSAVDYDALARPVSDDQWRDEFNLAADDVVAVVAAQFIERKGHRLLLQIVPGICAVRPEFRLLLFGQGPLESRLRRQVESLGIADHVRFAGFRVDLDRFLGRADLLVHPATQEGLGVIMLKAAAAGLPVVAFDIAGAREAVVNGDTGLLVPQKNSAALLQALTELIENRDKRTAMGMAGQSRMKKEFSIDAMIEQHLLLYKSMIDV